MRQNRELKAGASTGASWREMVGPLIAIGICGSGTVAAYLLGFGWAWILGGVVLTVLSLLVLMGSTSHGVPRGPVPARCEISIESEEGDAVAIQIIAIVRVATKPPASTNASELYAGVGRADVAAAAITLLESLVRAELGRRPRAELAKPTLLDHATPPGWFEDAFVRLALEVDALWVGPA